MSNKRIDKQGSSDSQRNNTSDAAPTATLAIEVNNSELTDSLPIAEAVTATSSNTEEKDIFSDLAALGCSFEKLSPSVKVLSSLEVRKPEKNEWISCHENIFTVVSAYLDKKTKEVYLILPQMIEPIRELVREVNMTLAVNYDGVPFIWPLVVPSEKSPHTAHLSAYMAANLAKDEWIRIHWEDTEYKVHKRTNKNKEPEWPSEIEDPSNMLRLANKFGSLEVVDTQDHPIIQALLGRD